LENPWQCPNVTGLTATEFLQIHPDGTISSNVDVTWHDPDVMLSGIEVSVLEEGDSTWKSCGIVSPGIENYVIRNIRWNQTISIRVVAINTNGIKASGVFTSLTLYGKELPPGPPTNLKVSGGAQHIALSWDNPPDVDFSHVDIVEYKGTAHPGYDPSIGTLVASISGNSFTRGGIPLITETMIADDAISTPKLQTNAVTSDKIAANSITSSKINVDTLSAISADLGTITAGIAKSADGKLVIDLANRTIRVYDDNNTLRVQLGALS